MSSSNERTTVHPADSISVGLSDHALRLHFLLDHQDGQPSEEQTAVFMTHKTMKMLQLVLTSAVEAIEATHGPIPFDEKRMNDIDTQFKNSIRTAGEASA